MLEAKSHVEDSMRSSRVLISTHIKIVLAAMTALGTANAFAMASMRLNDLHVFQCDLSKGQMSCVVPFNQDISVTIDPSKGHGLAVPWPNEPNSQEQLQEAINDNDRSRLLLCIHAQPINFLKGIVLFEKADPSKILLIDVLDEGKEPTLLYPPEETTVNGRTDSEICDQSFIQKDNN
jgi:hypothetical protein